MLWGHLIGQCISIQKQCLQYIMPHLTCVAAPQMPVSSSLSLLFSQPKMPFMIWGQHGRCGQSYWDTLSWVLVGPNGTMFGYLPP